MFIVLDLDEVLVDFTGGAARVFGKSVEEMGKEFGTWWSGEGFWGPIRDYGIRQFWEDLPLLPWAEGLLRYVSSAADEWIILTATIPEDAVFPEDSDFHRDYYLGKRNFIRRVFGERFNRYVITEHKFLFAKEGRILIDDLDKNCLAFEAHGGESILFPSRFNRAYMHYDEPLEYVQTQFELCFD